jgi:hypothetical protein
MTNTGLTPNLVGRDVVSSHPPFDHHCFTLTSKVQDRGSPHNGRHVPHPTALMVLHLTTPLSHSTCLSLPPRPYYLLLPSCDTTTASLPQQHACFSFVLKINPRCTTRAPGLTQSRACSPSACVPLLPQHSAHFLACVESASLIHTENHAVQSATLSTAGSPRV